MRASLPFMSLLPAWLVKGVATVAGIGLIGPAPGTLGSLAGVIFYALLLMDASRGWSFFVTLLLLILGVLFSDEAEIRMKRVDPGCVVIDEFAVMPMVFMGIHWPVSTWAILLILVAGFVLFRVFDILKPFGISKVQDLPGGLGIMADDVLAAIVSCLILHAMVAVVQLFL